MTPSRVQARKRSRNATRLARCTQRRSPRPKPRAASSYAMRLARLSISPKVRAAGRCAPSTYWRPTRVARPVSETSKSSVRVNGSGRGGIWPARSRDSTIRGAPSTSLLGRPMSYVDAQLVDGEVVRYRAHLTQGALVVPYTIAAFGLFFVVRAFAIPVYWWFAWAFLALAAIIYAWCRAVYATSEFAVTNKRVIIKIGWVRRRTVETMLSKVEGINVDQELVGRLLGYGTLVVTGTGGTKEQFTKIANPFEFRRQVQGAIAAADELRTPGSAASVPGAGAGADRVERECPYCAERILAKAKVCRFCGRDVSATSTTS